QPLSAHSSLRPSHPPQLHALSLHDALPIWLQGSVAAIGRIRTEAAQTRDQKITALTRLPDVALTTAIATDIVDMTQPEWDQVARSEEHTSELQSRVDIVCRLLLEKKKQHTQ